MGTHRLYESIYIYIYTSALLIVVLLRLEYPELELNTLNGPDIVEYLLFGMCPTI
jgi:hypothetical protein